MVEHYGMANERFIIEPKSALYRGADARFGNVKGNGVVCLTEKRLCFEKLTVQRIEIDWGGHGGGNCSAFMQRENVFRNRREVFGNQG